MKKSILVLLLMFGFIFQNTFATDGYYRHGYGIKYSALGGSGVAVSLSSLGAISNPASISYLNNGFEVNGSFFSPDRYYDVKGNMSMMPGTFGLMPGKVESGSTSFIFPTLGGNLKLSEKFTVALSLYGNGGMNSDYPTNTFWDATTNQTGVNIEQMFGNLSFAYKLGCNHSLGVAGIAAWQRFRANGLTMFGGYSSDPNSLTGDENSSVFGFGFKVGYQGKLTEDVSFGAAFQSKIYMSEFERYKGLFAEAGDFDVPASWQVGFAFTPGNWKFLFDVKQILYSDVKSIANPMDLINNSPMLPNGSPNPNFQPLGSENGWGFGWNDVLSMKFGVMYSGFCGWDLMAGYSIGQNPINEKNVMFNILAPAVVEQHITFGVSKDIAKNHEITVAFMYAPENSIVGPNPLEAPNQQTIEIGMKQYQIEVGYSFSSF